MPPQFGVLQFSNDVRTELPLVPVVAGERMEAVLGAMVSHRAS